MRSRTVLPASGPASDAHFASLRGRTAAVVVWGAESTHRQVIVTDGSYEAMRVEAVAALAGFCTHLSGDWPSSMVASSARATRCAAREWWISRRVSCYCATHKEG